jgi:hypothetical protein
VYRRWALTFGLVTVGVAQLLAVVRSATLLTAPYLPGYVLLTVAGGLLVVAGLRESVAVSDRVVQWYGLAGLGNVLLAVTTVIWSVADATDGGTTTVEWIVLVAGLGVALALGYVGTALAGAGRSPSPPDAVAPVGERTADPRGGDGQSSTGTTSTRPGESDSSGASGPSRREEDETTVGNPVE